MNISKPTPTIDAFRCFAFDLDGTLLHSGAYLTERTKSILRLLMKQNKTIVIASGRIPGEITHLTSAVDLSHYDYAYFISYNGGRAEHPVSGTVVYESKFDPSHYEKIVHELYRRNLPIHVFSPEGIYLSENISDILQIDKNAPIRHIYADLRTTTITHAYKFLILGDSMTLNSLRNELTAMFPYVEIFKSHDRLLEIVPTNGTKGAALRNLSVKLGIKQDEIMAFGDEQNDISMLKASGYRIAMANANPSLFEISDVIISHHDEDGVAEYLESISNKE